MPGDCSNLLPQASRQESLCVCLCVCLWHDYLENQALYDVEICFVYFSGLMNTCCVACEIIQIFSLQLININVLDIYRHNRLPHIVRPKGLSDFVRKRLTSPLNNGNMGARVKDMYIVA